MVQYDRGGVPPEAVGLSVPWGAIRALLAALTERDAEVARLLAREPDIEALCLSHDAYVKQVQQLEAALREARTWTHAYQPLSELRVLIDNALAGTTLQIALPS